MIRRNLSEKGKLHASRSSQGTAMTKGHCFLSLSSMSRECSNFWVVSHFTGSRSTCRTEAEPRAYLSEFYFPNATNAEMDELLTLYLQNVTQGSPHDTGTQNALTPEFRRIASILGDYEFQAPRRFFLNTVSRQMLEAECLVIFFVARAYSARSLESVRYPFLK
jgi:hypothetical protein